MPGKLARSGPRPSFGLAAVPVTVGTSRLSCGNAVKREYSRRFGSHLGNPGLKVPCVVVGIFMLKTFPVFPLPPPACGANPNNVTLAVLSSSLYSAGVAWGSFSVDFARIGLGQGGNDGVPYNYFVDDL